MFAVQLPSIEKYIMKEMHPVVRLIDHMHYITESVGAGTDGPMKLYLDTVNTEVNVWGSSILPSHQDVLRSATQQETNAGVTCNNDPPFKPYANVMFTLGILTRRTLIAFDKMTTGYFKINHFILHATYNKTVIVNKFETIYYLKILTKLICRSL